MTTPSDPGALVRQMLECFNTRQFDRVADLVTPDYFSHVLGTTGFDTTVWHTLVARFPEIRLVAEDVVVDRDKVAIRSAIEGIESPDGVTQPMLMEIFHVRDGRLAEMWGLGQGLPYSAETFTSTPEPS
jgi:hypothetical protein